MIGGTSPALLVYKCAPYSVGEFEGGKNMYAINAIYDGVNFKPMQPIAVKGTHRVVITFLEQVADGVEVMEQSKKRPRSEIICCLKGKVWMADDFNDPIEELEEYM